MVRFNSKRFLATTMAVVMVFGSSVTAFATSKNADGTGVYEGDDVTFAAATTLDVPTTPTTGFGFIADPNGLIAEAAENGKSDYQNYIFDRSNTHGVYFPTSEADGKTTYTEKSASLEVVNLNAAPIVVTAKVAQKTAGTGVVFNDDSTFKDVTVPSIYIAVTDGGSNTAAIKAGGAEVGIAIPLNGKISNYQLEYDTDKYQYALKDGVTAAASDTSWNRTSFYVTGALNEDVAWKKGEAALAAPSITVTWDVQAGAVPVKIKNGIPATAEMTYKKASVTVSKIKLGANDLQAAYYTVDQEPAADKVAKITFKSEATAAVYKAVKNSPDGVVLTVVYSDDTTEPLVVFAK